MSTFLGPPSTPTPDELEVEQTDELGRVTRKPTLTTSKHERQEARRKRRQLRQQRHAKPEEEGYSTDSSLAPHDASAYSAALKSLAIRTKDVLADVKAEEFLDPSKGRWNTWRDKYLDSYVGAWGGLGVVSVWEFWVRLEMVGWHCIEVCPFSVSWCPELLTMFNRILEIWIVSNGIKDSTHILDRM